MQLSDFSLFFLLQCCILKEKNVELITRIYWKEKWFARNLYYEYRIFLLIIFILIIWLYICVCISVGFLLVYEKKFFRFLLTWISNAHRAQENDIIIFVRIEKNKKENWNEMKTYNNQHFQIAWNILLLHLLRFFSTFFSRIILQVEIFH